MTTNTETTPTTNDPAAAAFLRSRGWQCRLFDQGFNRVAPLWFKDSLVAAEVDALNVEGYDVVQEQRQRLEAVEAQRAAIDKTESRRSLFRRAGLILALAAGLAVAGTLCTGCDVGPAGTTPANVQGDACGREVVQADLCPDGVTAVCWAGGETDGVSTPVEVTGCDVAHKPTETTTAHARCVAACQ